MYHVDGCWYNKLNLNLNPYTWLTTPAIHTFVQVYTSKHWGATIHVIPIEVIYLLSDTFICRLRMRRNCWESFPRHWLQRKPLVSDPGMHYGMGVTHVPWYMSGSLTRSGGENTPGIPGACHAQPAVLRIWQEAYEASFFIVSTCDYHYRPGSWWMLYQLLECNGTWFVNQLYMCSWTNYPSCTGTDYLLTPFMWCDSAENYIVPQKIEHNDVIVPKNEYWVM